MKPDDIRHIHAAIMLAEASGFTGYAKALRALLNHWTQNKP